MKEAMGFDEAVAAIPPGRYRHFKGNELHSIHIVIDDVRTISVLIFPLIFLVLLYRQIDGLFCSTGCHLEHTECAVVVVESELQVICGSLFHPTAVDCLEMASEVGSTHQKQVAVGDAKMWFGDHRPHRLKTAQTPAGDFVCFILCNTVEQACNIAVGFHIPIVEQVYSQLIEKILVRSGLGIGKGTAC